MKTLVKLVFLTMALVTTSAADHEARHFEMRTYYAAPGKLDELHARFRDHTCRLFEKHGMQNIGYWVPLENPENKLIYILAYPDRDAREKSWKAFMADLDWQKARKESEQNGRLATKVEQVFLSATDYSPEIKPSIWPEPRVFELRTYKCSANNLPILHDRFRDHTMTLFSKHGMSHIGYWTPANGRQGAEDTLIYILAHKSKEAGEASFKAFRADPDWAAARKASEEKAGGSLTVPDGVKSVYMRATDYSQTR